MGAEMRNDNLQLWQKYGLIRLQPPAKALDATRIATLCCLYFGM